MHIICNDGTTIQCRDFEATDSGVLFFQETTVRREGDEEEEEEEEAELGSADGFVPIQEVRFVLPDEMVRASAGAQRAGAPEGSRGAPPAGQPTGGTTQQQGMGGRQGTPQRRGPGPQ